MPASNGYRGKNRLLAALPAEDFDRFFSALEPIDLALRQVIQEGLEALACECYQADHQRLGRLF